MTAIGFPKTRAQFKEWRSTDSVTPTATQGISNDIGDVKPPTTTRPMFGDATLTILTNKNNPIVEVRFIDVYPAWLSSLDFTHNVTVVEYLSASVDFDYTLYEIVTL